MNKLVSAMLIVAAIIHLMPLIGSVGADRLNALYGLVFDDPNLRILMRHRAVLFGILGCLLLTAAFFSTIQWTAIIAGLVSVIAFIILAWLEGNNNAEIRRVVMMDWLALACLLVAITGLLAGSRSVIATS